MVLRRGLLNVLILTFSLTFLQPLIFRDLAADGPLMILRCQNYGIFHLESFCHNFFGLSNLYHFEGVLRLALNNLVVI